MNPTTMPWQEANVIHPMPSRSLSQRISAADNEWKALMTAVHSDRRCTPFAGARYLLHLRSFLNALITDTQLIERIEQHFEASIRNEGPKEQGKLI